MSVGMWQVTLISNLRGKKAQVSLQFLTVANSSKSAIYKVLLAYNLASLEVTNSTAIQVSEDCQQVLSSAGPILKKK